MPCGELPRLRHNESDAVVAVSDQIMVAKEKAWAQRSSDDAQFGKDRFYRRVKNGPGQRLKINRPARGTGGRLGFIAQGQRKPISAIHDIQDIVRRSKPSPTRFKDNFAGLTAAIEHGWPLPRLPAHQTSPAHRNPAGVYCLSISSCLAGPGWMPPLEVWSKADGNLIFSFTGRCGASMPNPSLRMLKNAGSLLQSIYGLHAGSHDDWGGAAAGSDFLPR